MQRRAWLTLSNWLALLVAYFALITLLGYLLNSAVSPVGMSVASSFGFLFLGISLLFTRFNPLLLSVFARGHALGFVALRLVIFGISMPVIIFALAAWWLFP